MALGDSQMVGIPKKPVPGDAHQRSPSHDPASWKFQLLACPEVRALDKHVLQLAPRYLRSECSQMQWLMLNALITTCDEPSKAKSMWILQESLLELLQDLDDEVVETNLSLLKMMLQAANSPVCSTLVLELTGRLQPLFHHTTSSVQLLSLELFQRLMQSVNKKERQPMKTRVYENVIELLCLLHAESPEVAEASRVTLLGAAAFLKKRRLRKLLEKRKTLEVGKYLLSGCGSRAAHYVQQAARCLWSHQQPIREAAVRFLGLAGQHLRGHQELLQPIHEALENLPEDTISSVANLAAQTQCTLRDAERAAPSRLSLREWLRRAWSRRPSLWARR
ncbi:uncharacterized protein LOC133626648 [Colius striatus]|uniref:uncharacterized protein LOC133626648 n=1 Tax=Colius striatus TaxID=57412 RepID=UPI002B1D4F1D|nr:uncharacterized protein LOC133626648 [Colius striatus]